MNFGPSAVSRPKPPDFARPPMGLTGLATRRGPRRPSCVCRIVRKSAWHGNRRKGSGCCCPRPIRHGLAARCGQVRSPRGQSRRRHNHGRGVRHEVGEVAGQPRDALEVSQASTPLKRTTPGSLWAPGAVLSFEFRNRYAAGNSSSTLKRHFIVESQFVI